MVELHNVLFVGSKLDNGEYKSEDVTKHFRYYYGDKFTAHDLNLTCSLLGWHIKRRSGKSDIISVTHTFIK